jgi:tRNA-dihydrouridine synthase B
LKIGAYALANPVFLAPMAGVTDLPFRKLCRELGAGMVVGEMLASAANLRDTAKSRQRGVHLDEPEPRAVQIAGWDPAVMADAARFNVDQGASIIDINMGCPAKKVCNRLAGSALLGDERRVGEILAAVVRAVPVPVTLKMRTGLDPARRNAPVIAGIAEDCGIQAITVHGRTRSCFYRGEAEFDTLRRVRQRVGIPVIANGDIRDARRAREVMEMTGADGVMIGRGAHGAPWLPGVIARALEAGGEAVVPDLARQGEIVSGHLCAIHAFYGETQGVRIARKHIKWYTADFPGNDHFRDRVMRAETCRNQLNLTTEYYIELQDVLRAA